MRAYPFMIAARDEHRSSDIENSRNPIVRLIAWLLGSRMRPLGKAGAIR